MAARGQKDWLWQMRSTIQAMTKNVTEISSSSAPQSSMQAHIPNLQRLRSMLQPIASLSFGSQGGEAFPTTQVEHALFVQDLVSLLVALVPRLDWLGRNLSLPGARCSIGTTQEDLFWELWAVLAAGFDAFWSTNKNLPELWPYDRQPANLPLHAAFASVIAWLLTVSRSPAWMSMQHKHGLQQRNVQLVRILLQPAMDLVKLSLASPPIATRLLTSVSPLLLPTLCCIISEQFVHNPVVETQQEMSAPLQAGQALVAAGAGRTTTYKQSLVTKRVDPLNLHYLCKVLSTGINSMFAFGVSSASFRAVLNMLQHPAILHFLKCIFLMPPETPSSSPGLMVSSVEVLYAVLGLHLNNTGTLLSVKDRVANRDAAGLPLHLNPLLSQPCLETDGRVLHVLSTIPANGDNHLPGVICGAQLRLLQTWHLASQMYPAPKKALVAMTGSIVGLSKRCAMYGLLVVQREAQRATRQARQETFSQLQHLKALPRDALEKFSGAAALLDSDGRTQLRSLVLLTSDTQLQSVNGTGMLFERTGPVFKSANTWGAQRGWAVAVEALHRGENSSLSIGEAHNLARICMIPLTLLSRGNLHAALPALISLAATMRKQLWPQIIRDNTDTGSVGVRGIGGVLAGLLKPKRVLSKTRRLTPVDTVLVDAVVHTLSSFVLHLDGLMGEGCSGTSSSNSSSSSKNGSSNGSASPTSESVLVHQLQSILMLTAFQICLWRVDCEGVNKNGFPEWLGLVSMFGMQLQNPHLSRVATEFLCETRFEKASEAVSLVWERHAKAHFHGRLLPGCCNMDCTNLDGVSEVGLKTLLCSGCRNTRYCSVACQKAAWCHGGHGVVCGL